MTDLQGVTVLDDAAVDRLRDRFLALDYATDPVLAAIGEAGQAGLGRNSTVPADRHLDDSDLAIAIRLWLLQQSVPLARLRSALGDSLDDLAGAGLLTVTGDVVRAEVDIRPYGAEISSMGEAAGWLVSDLTPGLDHVHAPVRPDYVLGASPASTSLAQLTLRSPVGRALDLGTGCGVQTLHLASHADHVVGTDLNPRALALADLTLRLSGHTPDLRQGDLYAPVATESFDLIVTNPPFVMSPPTGERLTYREGTLTGDGLMRRVVTEGTTRLAPGGVLQVLGNWAHVAGQPWQDRLADWVEGTGCDLFAVQREVVDVHSYIELWLADAGLIGSASYLPRYREWLDYFAGLDIEAVGMGWITVHRAERRTPDLQCEDWPHAVEQPVAPAIAAQLHGVELAALDDDALAARRWRLTEDVVQETHGPPGATDPEHLVLRQQRGLRRGMSCDTALAAVLGACDGDLELCRIVAAVADLLEVDQTALWAGIAPRIRTALREGYLVEG